MDNNYYYNIIKNSGKVIKQYGMDGIKTANQLALDGIEKAKDRGDNILLHVKDVKGSGEIVKQLTLDVIEKVKNGGDSIVQHAKGSGEIAKQLTLGGIEKVKDSGVVQHTKYYGDLAKQLSLDGIEKVKNGGDAIVQHAKGSGEIVKQLTLDGIEKVKDESKVIVKYSQDGSKVLVQHVKDNGLVLAQYSQDGSKVLVQHVKDHPYAYSFAIGIALSVVLLPVVAHSLGFGVVGIAKYTYAAGMMSKLTSGSKIVAVFQSIGAKSTVLHLINPLYLGVATGAALNLDYLKFKRYSSIPLSTSIQGEKSESIPQSKL